MTVVTTMELDEADAQPLDRPRPKVGRIPVTLRLLNESETSDESWQENTAATRKGDTQFMLLLVTLFIIVNLTLITLLQHKDKTPGAKPAVIAHHITATPEAPVAATVPAPQQVTPQAVTAPVAPTIQAAPASYVTPVAPGTTRTTSAPFQQVIVSDRSAAAPAVAAQANQAAPQAAMPDMAPAAGIPAPAATQQVTPEKAKQDLLSVINKD